MAKVTYQADEYELRREERGIYFWAENKDGAVGTLVVSKGGLRWFPGHSTKKHHFLSWEKLARELPKLARVQT